MEIIVGVLIGSSIITMCIVLLLAGSARAENSPFMPSNTAE